MAVRNAISAINSGLLSDPVGWFLGVVVVDVHHHTVRGDEARRGTPVVGVGGGDIPAAEQHLPARCDGSDRAELVVSERL